MIAILGVQQWLWSEIGLILEAAGFLILILDLIRSFWAERGLSEELANAKRSAFYAPYAAFESPRSPMLYGDIRAADDADRLARVEALNTLKRRFRSVAIPAMACGALGFVAGGIGNWHGTF